MPSIHHHIGLPTTTQPSPVSGQQLPGIYLHIVKILHANWLQIGLRIGGAKLIGDGVGVRVRKCPSRPGKTSHYPRL